MRQKGIAPAPRSTAQLEPATIPGPARSADDRSSVVVRTKSAVDVIGRAELTTKEIRERAYYIYLARGGVNGDPVSDWYKAERELREELRRTAATAGRRF